jgi:hypothetical protein
MPSDESMFVRVTLYNVGGGSTIGGCGVDYGIRDIEGGWSVSLAGAFDP